MVRARKMSTENPEQTTVQQIPLKLIKPNPYQPRKVFDEEKLADLADSVRQYGILQPIVLRETVKGYHIVVGERRYRAAQLVDLENIPATVQTMSDEEMMELAIIENLQREDLSAIEEAESYKALMTDLNLTQQQVAKRLSKSRPYIANMLRLLNLPKSIAQMIQHGELSGGHGRTLLALSDVTEMKKIAKRAVAEGWSVRYLEQFVNEKVTKGTPKKTSTTQEQPDFKPKFIQQQERQLKEQYGANVEITTKRKKGRSHLNSLQKLNSND